MITNLTSKMKIQYLHCIIRFQKLLRFEKNVHYFHHMVSRENNKKKYLNNVNSINMHPKSRVI